MTATGPTPDQTAPRPKDSLATIQALRGVAALAVVAFHTHTILLQPEYGGHDVFGLLASRGWLGVNFFFVLSGFIILYAHTKDIGQPAAIPRYLWRRISRVYPIYWVLLTCLIAAAAVGIGYPDFRWEFAHFFTAYSLIQVVDVPTMPLKVAWTLLFEIKFYLMFVIFLFSRSLGLVVFALWALAIVVRNAFLPLPDWGYLLPDWGLLSIWNINFLFGMGAAWLFRNRDLPALPMLVAATALILALALMFDSRMAPAITQPLLMGSLGFGFAAIILGAALAERRYALRVPGWIMLIGNASYAIYLVHSAAISQVANFNHKFADGLLPDWMLFVVTFTVATVGGVVTHIVLEKPLLHLFKTPPWSAPKQPSPVARPSW